VRGGTLAHALMAALIVGVPELWVAVPAMVVVGMAWLTVANSLSVAAQSVLPDWVRARGMAIYQMSLMGGAAFGGLLWGQVAGLAGVEAAVLASAGLGAVIWFVTRRHAVDAGPELDYSPAPTNPRPEPAIAVEPDEGPVMVTFEYLIDPARADEFAAVMQRTRGARLRQGALSWGLFRDTAHPGRYVEYFVDENWLEHQRRLERFTAFDAELRAQRLAFHLGAEPPKMQRYVADQRIERPSPPV
jgi:quinol monooxygenase YgiN